MIVPTESRLVADGYLLLVASNVVKSLVTRVCLNLGRTGCPNNDAFETPYILPTKLSYAHRIHYNLGLADLKD